jgi:Zn-dependent protease with chaperone function
LPGFELLVQKLSRYSLEQIVFETFCATGVRVTENQCAPIHKLLREACGVLDVPEPALFLSQNPTVNAFAVGREKPLMVLYTGLIEHLDDEELLSVIAHELGHIHCGHSVYRLMMELLKLASRIGTAKLGIGDALSFPIEMALLEWARKAEFSADRAAVLVTQNPDAVFSTLFKITGGSPKIYEMMDKDEYLKQAEEYEKPDASRLEKFYKNALESGMTHPIPVFRAREVLRYAESDEYKAIVAGRYIQRDKNGLLSPAAHTDPVVCLQCGKRADTTFTFCTNCGAELGEARQKAVESAQTRESQKSENNDKSDAKVSGANEVDSASDGTNANEDII